MKIVAVDFDGVLSDSAFKSLFVSHNVYCRYFGPEVKKNFSGESFTFENWEKMKQEYRSEMEKYSQLRAYIEQSGDFFVAIKILEEGLEINSQEDFQKIRNQIKFDYSFFRELFFQEKEKWQSEDFPKWFALSPIFREAISAVKRLRNEGAKIVIATSNLGNAIFPAFQPHYLGFKIDFRDIFDKTCGANKSDHMKAIAEQYQVRWNDIYFIDDQLSYLEEVQPLGVNVYLAGWGYCTENHKRTARRKGIRVIEKQEQFYPELKKELNYLQ